MRNDTDIKGLTVVVKFLVLCVGSQTVSLLLPGFHKLIGVVITRRVSSIIGLAHRVAE